MTRFASLDPKYLIHGGVFVIESFSVSISLFELSFIFLFLVYFCNNVLHLNCFLSLVLSQWYWMPIEPSSGNPDCVSTPLTPGSLCVQVDDVQKWSVTKVCVSLSEVLHSLGAISVTINGTQEVIILGEVDVDTLEPCTAELDGHVETEDHFCNGDFLICPGKIKYSTTAFFKISF